MGSVTTRDLMGGFVCGVLATGAMSGINTAIRRAKRPATGGVPPNPTHYEKIGERSVQILSGKHVELDDDTRVRLGEALHYLFGGVMGSAYVVAADRLPVPPALRGSVHGLALWTAAFAGYFPLLKAHPGVWTWGREEVIATLRAHLVYGNSVMLLTRGWQAIAR